MILFDYRALGSSRKLGGTTEHLIDGSKKRICQLSPHVIEKRSKTFFCSCVWWAMFCSFGQLHQTCLAHSCVSRLLSSLYPFFDLCLIKHALTVWSLTSTSACLVTTQCLMIFGHQTFPIWTGLKVHLTPNFFFRSR